MILGEPKLLASMFQLASGQVHSLQSAALLAVGICPLLHEDCGLLCPRVAVHTEIAQQFALDLPCVGLLLYSLCPHQAHFGALDHA